jgi:hypothetical protein
MLIVIMLSYVAPLKVAASFNQLAISSFHDFKKKKKIITNVGQGTN